MSEMFSRFEFQLIAYMNCENFVEQLDEPQKPVVPKFVAEWIIFCKNKNKNLSYAMHDNFLRNFLLEKFGDDDNRVRWLTDCRNQEIFAQAWLFGYEVEKEPLWGIKNVEGNYLTKCALWGKDGVNYSFEFNPSYRLLFTDKATADAAALLVNGTVEEVVEG